MHKVAKNSVAITFLALAGSCQNSSAIADSIAGSIAGSIPVTQPAATFSVSPATPATLQVYTTSPAPATLHVNSLNLPDHPTDWLTEQHSWNFGDPTGQTAIDPRTGQPVNLNAALQGPVAAYQYENPGTYQVVLTRTPAGGQSQAYLSQVVVPPSSRKVFYISPDGSDSNPGTDPAHPLQTAAAAMGHLADHTEVRFCRGSVYQIQSEFPMKKNDLLIDCYGDPTQPLPVLQRLNLPAKAGGAALNPDDCEIFTTWAGQTANITIRHIRVDSTYTVAFTAGQYAYHAPVATFGHLRGSNITVADCEFANILEGPLCDATANGVLLLRNRQIDPLGIPSRNFWMEGRNICVIGNLAINSVNESPFRAADTGVIGGLIAFNDIAQQLDAAHGRSMTKAAMTLRNLADMEVMCNRITNAEFSFDPDPITALDQRLMVENNQVFNSCIDIKSNVRHAVFRSNTIQRSGGPCISVYLGTPNPTCWIQDLQLINNTGQGYLKDDQMIWISPYTPPQLLQFVYDPVKNPYVKANAPVAK